MPDPSETIEGRNMVRGLNLQETDSELEPTSTPDLWMCSAGVMDKVTCEVDFKPMQNQCSTGGPRPTPHSASVTKHKCPLRAPGSQELTGTQAPFSKDAVSTRAFNRGPGGIWKCAKVFLVCPLTFREGHLPGMAHILQLMKQTYNMEVHADQMPQSTPH